MLKLPDNLLHVCEKFWPLAGAGRARASKNADPLSISIVTAFFDLGRENWAHGGKASPFQRSLDRYFDYFAHLAKIKNQLVIFTSPDLAQRVLDLRRAAGRENETVIFIIANLFDEPKLKSLESEVASKMTEAFRASTRVPNSPEYYVPRYVVMDALKSIFTLTALKAGVVNAQQLAWMDFGYCRDEQAFDASKLWRFDTAGKFNLFHMQPIDDMPIYDVVLRGKVYFQGGCRIAPVAMWPDFVADIDGALASLLSVDLVDDEQTLILMAWRKSPEKYRIFPMSRKDWRVAIKQFNETQMGEPVSFWDNELEARVKASMTGRVVSKIATALIRRLDFLRS